ncbi:DEAD/DEAH box helicase [Naumannella halotolerans]|uniref:Helicase-like protein n=1 Tax=Naumannella halotolerans TaxID=993414 RepID=A0A4R7JBY3_9ACTN|nr:DEAD/DEAH box helicase [Naumannella halotolerans]TDT34133.1 helicase-like protein [Naumannella halotolerans]
MATTLTDTIPDDPTPDALYEAFSEWARDRGTTLYPHQEEALLELVSGNNVIISTPTGSGKSMVALAAHYAALARDEVSFYSAPIKALVSEKFFDLVAVFGADNVGMVTGDGSVNADAPIICCTAEILANIALREGSEADVGCVIADEFHFYSEPDRGWAWQVPLLLLPQAQFVLMSATLGDVSLFTEDLTRRTGRETAVIAGTERPVPLEFEWSEVPIGEKIAELIEADRAPVYVVHFSQAAALEGAQSLVGLNLVGRAERDAIADKIGDFRFAAGFGRTLSRLVRAGIGVHHAGMLPKYRRLVEQLAQAGLLKIICGTDTLGVGINVPIRTVLLTGLTKFDGTKMRMLKAREFHQIAGRAGRAGFDTRGWVVVQAPEHVIENKRAIAKAGDDPKKQKKVKKKQPAEGQINWTAETLDRLIAAEPEPLQPRLRVTHSMLINLLARRGNPVANAWTLLTDNHQDEASRRRLRKHAVVLARELITSGVVERLPEAREDGRRYDLTVDLQRDFAVNQPMAPFALAALETLDPDGETYARDIVSVIESILEDPKAVLFAQQRKARGEAIGAMKAEGLDYAERMELAEEVSWPKPLEDLLDTALEAYRQSHPWLSADALSPKSIVREMYESAMTFGEYVSLYGLARSEGVLLRYLTDAYRTLRHTVPEQLRTEEFDDLVEWLGEVIRQTDSSLLDEWEALTNPAEAVTGSAPVTTIRPFTANRRALTVAVRNAMFARVMAAARDDPDALAAIDQRVAALTDPPQQVPRNAEDWADDLDAYYDTHDDIGIDAAARSPQLLQITEAGDQWSLRQVLDDPAGDHDWAIIARLDLAASDAAGTAMVIADGLRRLDG